VEFDYVIYTDGACLGNPGPGGWAAIIFYKKKKKKLIKGNKLNTTNNQMELLASIEALKDIENKSSIKIYTDSKYLIDGINIWIKKWKLNNWKTASRKEVKNNELWKELDLLSSNHLIKWEWVRGHSGNIFNEEVDKIAREEANLLKI
tara:strand:+ start:2580 stop:3023 length:444 start_codon:yes stop_codon:yes gene_type:complete